MLDFVVTENGVQREPTPDEIAEMERMIAEIQKAEPTPEERMNEIEAALIELAAMVGGA